MVRNTSGRDQLRAAIHNAAEATRKLEEDAENELDKGRKWLGQVRADLEADGCEIRTFDPNSYGEPLGYVDAGWCAVFPGTCVYLAVWEPGRVRTEPGTDGSAPCAPASMPIGTHSPIPIPIPRSVDTMSHRTLTCVGVYDGEATIEAWSWGLIVDTDSMQFEWAAFPHGTWHDQPNEVDDLGDHTGLEKALDNLMARFAETGSRSTPEQL